MAAEVPPASDAPARRLDALVRGRVQGVGFRMFVLETALDLGLVGWVANEPDGSVRAVAEGSELQLLRLLAALRDGPPAARVEEVRETWAAATGLHDGFAVRSGWHAGD
jgi:acylphosphatase